MGLFDKKKKKVTRTPARNTNSRKREENISNLGVSGMVRKLKQLNPNLQIFCSDYRGTEAIVIDVQKLDTLKFPNGYGLIDSTLTNSVSKEGMYENIRLVTKFDYNFTR